MTHNFESDERLYIKGFSILFLDMDVGYEFWERFQYFLLDGSIKIVYTGLSST